MESFGKRDSRYFEFSGVYCLSTILCWILNLFSYLLFSTIALSPLLFLLLMWEFFDNRQRIVWEDLKKTIKEWSKLNISAAIFSIYWFECLKEELNKIDSLNFIFTDPTFVKIDKESREQKRFGINSNKTIQSINGSDFEIHLKNEMKWRAIAKECKKWIEKKVKFKTNTSHRYIQPQIIIDNNKDWCVYSWLAEFSSAWFWYESDNAILRQIIKNNEYEYTKEFLTSFKGVWNDEEILKDVTDEVADYISNLYKENAPEFIYYITLYNIFDEFSKYIQKITWKYKLAESTIRLKKWKKIEEIQIFEIILKEKVLDKKIFKIIDKIIPYPILYECKYNDHVAYVILYNKEYYSTNRDEEIKFDLTWTNLDSVYKNIVSKFITDESIETEEWFEELMDWNHKKEALEKEIEKLKLKIKKEIQMKDKVPFNMELQKKKSELEKLLSHKYHK